MRTTSIWVLILAVGIALGALGSQVLSAPQEEFTRNVLLKTIALKPGTVVHMDPKKVHMARNIGTVPIKFMDFRVFEAGQPPSTPVK